MQGHANICSAFEIVCPCRPAVWEAVERCVFTRHFYDPGLCLWDGLCTLSLQSAPLGSAVSVMHFEPPICQMLQSFCSAAGQQHILRTTVG